MLLLKQWDDVHDQNYGYLATFFPDVVFILGSRRQTGHDEIRKSREDGTDPGNGRIVAVQHHLEKSWPLACQTGVEDSQELILTGNTNYTLKWGKVFNVAFDSRVSMKKIRGTASASFMITWCIATRLS